MYSTYGIVMRKFHSPFGNRMGLKVRKSKAPPPPKGCPMGACMALLGGAWTTNLVWQLSGGPRRFGETIQIIFGQGPVCRCLSGRRPRVCAIGHRRSPLVFFVL